jgi:hypothetical protein
VKILVFLILLLSVSPLNSWAGGTFDAVIAGKKCTEESTQQIDCEYKIGNSLHISIPGLGMPDTAVTFLRSDWNGDYYATFGMMHQCIVVKPGKKGASRPNPGKLGDFAFISPKNGKVYQDWETCMKGF